MESVVGGLAEEHVVHVASAGDGQPEEWVSIAQPYAAAAAVVGHVLDFSSPVPWAGVAVVPKKKKC